MIKIDISRWLKCIERFLLVSSKHALSMLTLICHEDQLEYMKPKYKDLAGHKFGKLVVLERSGHTKAGRTLWKCMCECGNEVIVQRTNLISGNTSSCGCNKKLGIKTHGKSDTPIYHVWQSMKTRCTNTKSNRYQYYGGKGIQYDPRWGSFEGFYEDMGERYETGLTLDRIDCNGGYTKENCRWVDYTIQNNNKADNIHLLYDGIKYTVQEAAKMFGISTYSIYNRKRRGWNDEKIVETPINQNNINTRYQKV